MAEPPLRVLIVDDEAPARRRLRELLDDCAAALPLAIVGEAQHGREALDILHTAPADLVLTDIHMPDMDGIELARHLLKLPHPPVVIFTTAFHEHALAGVRGQRGRLPGEAGARAAAARRAAEGAATEADDDRASSTQLPAAARRFLSVTERSRVVLVPVDEVDLSQGRAQVHHDPHCAARVPARGIADAARGGVRRALRARASQLPRRARLHPRLRAPRRTTTATRTGKCC